VIIKDIKAIDPIIIKRGTKPKIFTIKAPIIAEIPTVML